MTKAEEFAKKAYPDELFPGETGYLMRCACAVGYIRAQLDCEKEWELKNGRKD